MKPFLVGLLAGILALGIARFAFAPWEELPHYHANWAVFVDGERLDLSADRYMEPVATCMAGDQILPANRVHMHDNDDAVVHVHHTGVTWGHFVMNLGWSLGDDYLILDDGRQLVESSGGSLKFVVNGFVVPSVRDRLIRSGDRLLISYGSETDQEALRTQFPDVATGAEELNDTPDPAGCAGADELSWGARLRRAFW